MIDAFEQKYAYTTLHINRITSNVILKCSLAKISILKYEGIIDKISYERCVLWVCRR